MHNKSKGGGGGLKTAHIIFLFRKAHLPLSKILYTPLSPQVAEPHEYKDKTKEVAHKVKHYGAFGEDYLGYSDPSKDLRKAVKAKEKAAKKAKKAKKKKGIKAGYALCFFYNFLHLKLMVKYFFLYLSLFFPTSGAGNSKVLGIFLQIKITYEQI